MIVTTRTQRARDPVSSGAMLEETHDVGDPSFWSATKCAADIAWVVASSIFADLCNWNGEASTSTDPGLVRCSVPRDERQRKVSDQVRTGQLRQRRTVAVAMALVCGVVAILNLLALLWPNPQRDRLIASATTVVLIAMVALLAGLKRRK